MKRRHSIFIDQGDTSRMLELIDGQEGTKEAVSGSWNYRRSGNHFEVEEEDKIVFTSAAQQHRRWKWSYADARTLMIGTEFDSASHKTGEEGPVFTALIYLKGIERKADGTFSSQGKGRIEINVNPYYTKGEISWIVRAYPKGE